MTRPTINLSNFPPIYVLPSSIETSRLHETEELITSVGGKLTYNASEARVFLTTVNQKKRAAFELRSRGVWTEEYDVSPSTRTSKRRKLSTSQTGRSSISKEVSADDGQATYEDATNQLSSIVPDCDDNVVAVVKLEWLRRSVEDGLLSSLHPFLIYRARTVEKPRDDAVTVKVSHTADQKDKLVSSNQPATTTLRLPPTSQPPPSTFSSRFPQRRFKDQHSSHKSGSILSALSTHPRLHRATTSEHDFTHPSSLVPPPAWLLSPHNQYSCRRSTPLHPHNAAFLSHLHRIKEARLLTLDEIGVRAYSTAIASISALDREIISPHEITRLPGCSDKIAMLWIEWYDSAPSDPDRRLQVTDALEIDPDLAVLRLFWNIWGVGPETARKFYFDKGWKDLDDLVEFGWNESLTRVQQIGVKFYDEFLVKIPRTEVEEIANIILHHARLAAGIPKHCWSNEKNNYSGNWAKPDDGRRDADWDPRDIFAVIVGGYRRGKELCGDVDIILSHRDENKTKDLVVEVVKRLEDTGYITHTLTLHTMNSERDQQTLPFRGAKHGHGFDTLDKALCVWQDPNFDRGSVAGKHEDESGGAQRKNPNLHRRVDIIVSPWHTIGAAVLGWSGATTFERDIRQWCAKERGWKFDSSGVRDRVSGAVLDLESKLLREDEVKDSMDTEKSRTQREQTAEIDGTDTVSETESEDETGRTKSSSQTVGRSQRQSQRDYSGNTGYEDEIQGWEDRERILMENIGIGWRPARERCTG